VANPTLQQTKSTDSLLGSIAGNPGLTSLSTLSLPVPLASALQGALSVDGTQDPQDPVPRDTRTKQQRAADDAAGKVFDPATGDTKDATDPDVPTDVPSWIPDSLKWLFSPEWLQQKLSRVGLILVLLVLGGAFVYFGTKTLAD
jgi:hypothetical protein